MCCHLPDIMTATIFEKIVNDVNYDGMDDYRWFGPPQNLFLPVDILNGYSIIEFFCDNSALIDTIKYLKDEAKIVYYDLGEKLTHLNTF